MSKCYVSLYVLFLSLVATGMQAHTIGSNTLVARQREVYLRSGELHSLIGFSVFEGGIVLENSSTMCEVDVFFPLSGNLVLSGGTLALKKDLVFQSPFYLGSGVINGNSYSIEFPGNVSTLQIPCCKHSRVLSVLDQVDALADINSVDWSFDDKYVAIGTDGMNGDSELRVYYFDGAVLTYTASYDFSNKSVNSVRWHPSDYYLAVGRTANDELNIFQLNVSSGAFTLTDSKNVGTVHAVAWHPNGTHLAVGQDNASDMLLYSITDGVLGTVSSVDFGSARSVSRNALEWNSDGSYLAAGLYKKGQSDDVLVYSFDGASLTLNASIEIGQNVYAVSWHPYLSQLAIGASSGTQCLRIYDHDGIGGSLTEVTTARINEVKSIYGLSWDSTGALLASARANDSNGFDVKVLYYDSQLETLSLLTGYETSDSVECVAWAHTSQYLASGDQSDMLRTYELLEKPLTFKDVKLFFGSDVEITSTIRFEGECTINSGNNNIDISGGMLVVADDAQLQIERALVKGIVGNNIHCTSDSGILSLRDVVWQLDGDVTFSTGALIFENQVFFTGDATFAYQSSKTSTVLSKSELELDSGITFSYDPIVVAEKDLFAFESETAKLSLNGATLLTTVTGMDLTQGTLSIKRDAYLTAQTEAKDGYVINVGFTIGNSSISDDFKIDILGGETLYLTSGKISYKNVDSASLSFGSMNSSLYLYANTRFNIYENISLLPGYLSLDSGVTIARASGKEITGSIRPTGRYFSVNL